jgi:hypothetical protein
VHTMNQDGSAAGNALVYCKTMHYVIRPRLFRLPQWSAAMRSCSDTVQANVGNDGMTERGRLRDMAGRFSAALIITAAALVAVPQVHHPGGTHRAFGWGDSAELASGSVPHVPSFRRSPVSPLHPRPSPDGQSGPWPVAHVNRLPVLPGHILAPLQGPSAPLPAKSARHFPLFPTGPPSHG